MALFTCPDCGNTISDKAITCPHCGRPIASENVRQKRELSKESIAYLIFAAISLIAPLLPYSYQGLNGLNGQLLSKTQYNLWTVISTGATGKEGTGVQLFWHIVLIIYFIICIIGIIGFFVKLGKIDFDKIKVFLPFVAGVLFVLYEVVGTKYYKEFNEQMAEIGTDVFACGRSAGFYLVVIGLVGWIGAAIYIKTKAPKDTPLENNT